MSKLKLCNPIVLAIATLCLIALPVQAATKKTQPAKERPTPAKDSKAKDHPAKVQPEFVPSQVPSQPGGIFRECAACPDMVVIPAGSFDMGSYGSDEKDEKPERRITIEQPYAIGKIEITRGQFAAFVSATHYDAGDKCLMLADGQWEEFNGKNWRNPGYAQDDNHPVACVNWSDAQAYVKWLSQQTGKHYQLPGESQWEYACRAGMPGEYCGGDNVDSMTWYEQNSGNATHPAAAKQANAFGLYDMSGNVGEWLEDNYHGNYSGLPSDGSAWTGESATRVMRGGSWASQPRGVRAASRSASAPEYRYYDTGFRVVRMLR
ncbi:MAG: formylglycine-generating enzyme family protein [Nitrosomonadales bacterium]|nr:formylglycine-generating enzyme family protein [Nitrosomonadales bacterium]